jgi:hypothetical protein
MPCAFAIFSNPFVRGASQPKPKEEVLCRHQRKQIRSIYIQGLALVLDRFNAARRVELAEGLTRSGNRANSKMHYKQ